MQVFFITSPCFLFLASFYSILSNYYLPKIPNSGYKLYAHKNATCILLEKLKGVFKQLQIGGKACGESRKLSFLIWLATKLLLIRL